MNSTNPGMNMHPRLCSPTPIIVLTLDLAPTAPQALRVGSDMWLAVWSENSGADHPEFGRSTSYLELYLALTGVMLVLATLRVVIFVGGAFSPTLTPTPSVARDLPLSSTVRVRLTLAIVVPTFPRIGAIRSAQHLHDTMFSHVMEAGLQHTS